MYRVSLISFLFGTLVVVACGREKATYVDQVGVSGDDSGSDAEAVRYSSMGPSRRVAGPSELLQSSHP